MDPAYIHPCCLRIPFSFLSLIHLSPSLFSLSLSISLFFFSPLRQFSVLFLFFLFLLAGLDSSRAFFCISSVGLKAAEPRGPNETPGLLDRNKASVLSIGRPTARWSFKPRLEFLWRKIVGAPPFIPRLPARQGKWREEEPWKRTFHAVKRSLFSNPFPLSLSLIYTDWRFN